MDDNQVTTAFMKQNIVVKTLFKVVLGTCTAAYDTRVPGL